MSMQTLDTIQVFKLLKKHKSAHKIYDNILRRVYHLNNEREVAGIVEMLKDEEDAKNILASAHRLQIRASVRRTEQGLIIQIKK